MALLLRQHADQFDAQADPVEQLAVLALDQSHHVDQGHGVAHHRRGAGHGLDRSMAKP